MRGRDKLQEWGVGGWSWSLERFVVTGHFWVNPSVARPTQSGARHPSAEASPFGWPGSADVNLYGQVLNCLSDRWSPFQECWFHAGHGKAGPGSSSGLVQSRAQVCPWLTGSSL